jgi:hypothetical protein
MQSRKGQISRQRSKFRSAAALWLPALWIAAIAVGMPGILAADDADLGAALQQQQELLDQMGEGEEGPGASLLAGVEDSESDPRIAPRTPIPRDLPVAIFDEQKVIVRAGEWGRNDQMDLLKRILDADGDGKPEVERFVDPKSDLMVRQIEDRNYDGVQDTWSDFEWGAVSVRVLYTIVEGNPDTWVTLGVGVMTGGLVDGEVVGVRVALYF